MTRTRTRTRTRTIHYLKIKLNNINQKIVFYADINQTVFTFGMPKRYGCSKVQDKCYGAYN